VSEAGRVASQSLSALTATSSSSDAVVSTTPPATSSPGGSAAELVPVRDVVPPPPAAQPAAAAGLSEHAPHHGSMTFIVDFGDSGASGCRTRPGGGGGGGGKSSAVAAAATPLSEFVPARLRRKSIPYRTERDERDEDQRDHDAEVTQHSRRH